MKRYLFVLLAAISLNCTKNTTDYSEVISEIHSCHDTAQWTASDLFNAFSGTSDPRYVQAWRRAGHYESATDYAGWSLSMNADSTYSINGAETVLY